MVRVVGGSASRWRSRVRGRWALGLLLVPALACDRRVESFPDEGIADEAAETEGESEDADDEVPIDADESGGSVSCSPEVVDLRITDATNPASVECVERVTGNLTIGPTTTLTDLSILSELREVGGSIELHGNLSLTSLEGLEQLESASWLHVRRNNALGDLHGLDGLTTVSHITIANNDALTSLAGLPEGLSPAVLEIADNDSLERLDGLPVFLAPGDGSPLHVEVENHGLLSDLGGLSTCCSAQPIALLLARNAKLVDLGGLEQFQRFNALRLDDNRALASLEGVDASEIDTLELTYNRCETTSIPSLVDFEGLEELTSVGVMRIEWASSVESFAGLASLVDVSKLYVRNNVSLPWSAVLELVAKTGPVFEGCGGIGGPTCVAETCQTLF